MSAGKMSAVTELWARTSPGVAYAAGLPVGVESLFELETAAPDIRRRAATLVTGAAASPDEALILAAVGALAETVRPVHTLREVLEWIRALVYLERLGTRAATESDAALGDGLPAAVRRAQEGTLPEVILTRSLVVAIEKLAADAHLPRTVAAAAVAAAQLGDIPLDPDWATLEPHAPALWGALGEPAYAALLKHGYGLETPVAELEARVMRELQAATTRLRALATAVGARMSGSPATPEEVMRAFDLCRSSGRGALDVAIAMAQQSTDHLDKELIALDPQERAVTPAATPAAMQSLVTEGEEYLAGGLTNTPKVHCFITPAKCGSVYTLANVLFHELAHCWNMLKSCRSAADVPPPFRIAGTLGMALVEGIATRREREVYELYRDADPGSPYGQLFALLPLDRTTLTQEFELDTEYWWVARLVRALFDFRVQAGRQGYVDFVREMSRDTGLSAARIHAACFSFFERAGYAPCYAVGALLLEDLEHEMLSIGWSRRTFATRISSIAMLPPQRWRDALSAG